MPNYVTSVLYFEGAQESIDHVLGQIAFRPTLADDPEETRPHGIGTIDFNQILPLPVEKLILGHVSDAEQNAAASIGRTTGLDWKRKNWGTKWNACGGERLSPSSIRFTTAWNPPIPVIKALSGYFPDLGMCLEYADENLGCGCGEILFKAGEIVSHEIPQACVVEAYELAARVHGIDLAEKGYVRVGDFYEWRAA